MKEIRDSYIFDRIAMEEQQQNRNLELIASENYVSREVLKAIGCCCTNKYSINQSINNTEKRQRM